MNTEIMAKLKIIFELCPSVKLAYFFGSRARKDNGPLSDYDFAFYLDEKDSKKIFKIKLSLLDQISRLLKTDKVDVVIFNFSESPELKYNIIQEGELIYEQEPYKVMVEPMIFNEYFDFHFLLAKNQLTRA